MMAMVVMLGWRDLAWMILRWGRSRGRGRRGGIAAEKITIMVLIAIIVASITAITTGIITIPAKTARVTTGLHQIIVATTDVAAARAIVVALGPRGKPRNATGGHLSMGRVAAKGGEQITIRKLALHHLAAFSLPG